MNPKPKSRMRRWIIALVVVVVVAGGADSRRHAYGIPVADVRHRRSA